MTTRNRTKAVLTLALRKHLVVIPAFVVMLLIHGVPQAKAQTLEGNIRAWWLMGENAAPAGGLGSGITSIPDNSGNSVAANAIGSPQRVAGNAFAPFAFPASFASTTGAAGHYLVPDHASHDVRDESFSVSLWARSDGNGGEFDKLFARGISNSFFYQLETDGQGGVIWNIRSGGNAEINTRNVFDGNSDWHHFVATHNEDTGQIALFVDGVADDGNGGRFASDFDSSGVGDIGGASDLAIGSQTNGGAAFPGEIDDFRIYDVALTAADVTAIYGQGAGDFNVIPEPSTFLLAGFGLLALLGFTRRRRR